MKVKKGFKLDLPLEHDKFYYIATVQHENVFENTRRGYKPKNVQRTSEKPSFSLFQEQYGGLNFFYGLLVRDERLDLNELKRRCVEIGGQNTGEHKLNILRISKSEIDGHIPMQKFYSIVDYDYFLDGFNHENGKPVFGSQALHDEAIDCFGKENVLSGEFISSLIKNIIIESKDDLDITPLDETIQVMLKDIRRKWLIIEGY